MTDLDGVQRYSIRTTGRLQIEDRQRGVSKVLGDGEGVS
jgi:hypothetical protein